MRLPRLLALAALTTVGAAPLAAQEIDNVAAFARLYGVARWFYPSDAAATLDWNRFAVYGVGRVRAARSAGELEATLEELFTPLGPGIEIGMRLPAKPAAGRRDAALIAWRYRGAGMSQSIRGPYSGRRVNRAAPPSAQENAASFAPITQMIKADTLRGRTIRMRGRMRVADPNAPGWAGLWLRVDRAPQGRAFFDNMQDRPVRDTAWREYIIEGPIASDATEIYFGALTSGSMTADIGAIELAVRSEGGAWTPLVVRDRWGGPGARSNYVYTWPTEGQRFIRIAPAAVTQSGAPVPPEDAFETPIAGASVDIELARGLKARVPLSLTDDQARSGSPKPFTVENPWGKDDVDVRLADVVVAWNVFRHFYPYLSDLNLDWDARLRSQLETAVTAGSPREAHLDAVRALVADARDGHGSVREGAQPLRTGRLPVYLRILGPQLVVTASNDSAVPKGSVITAFDGEPAATRVEKETRLASGTPQWKRTRAEGALPSCKLGSSVKLTIEPPSGPSRDATLSCAMVAPPREARPDSIAELEPGIMYVDITRVRAAQLQEVIGKLASARGVVFDLRGYPTDIGAQILPYMLSDEEQSTDRWMHVSRIAGPFGEITDWSSLSWNLQPASQQISARRVFLTDGRAISYAESVMGYVRDHKMATIIGGTTAGTNGNVADFNVPGGFTVVFTGMRVTRHDGRTPYHMVGVSPDIPLEPTLAGIRAGRDEVLQRAISLLRGPQP